MIKFGSKVKIDEGFKNGFYKGEEGVVVNYRFDGSSNYVVELKTPLTSNIKGMTVVISEDYLTEI